MIQPMGQGNALILRTVIALEVATIAWGALSFGAVYPWGYWPLLISSVIIGLIAFPLAPVAVDGAGRIGLILGAIGAFIAFQLVPVAGPTLVRWSPARHRFLANYDVLYSATPGSMSHAWSINPSATLVALTCFVAFSFLLVGTARLVSVAGTGLLVKGLIGFGLLLAVFAVAQNMTLTGRTGEGRIVYIYGFWPDPYVNKPFGPFINKNNFAGWMLMALPLALGYVGAKVAESRRAGAADWRRRVLWLSSPGGAGATVALIAALAMGVALLMTMSRSGMLAFSLTVLFLAWAMPGARSTGYVRLVRVGVSLLLLLVLVVWVGTDVVAERFADETGTTVWGRIATWKDAIRIARDFPVIGTGVNTFRTAMLTYQTSDPANYWSEAHNDYLQLFAEGGFILLVLVALAAGAVVVEIRRRFHEESPRQPAYWIRLGAVAGLTGIAVQELVEFSLQIPGNAALFVALIGIALHRQPARPVRSRS